MAVSDYTGTSPRMQQQPDRLVLNPDTGEVELVPGEMQELSPNQEKQGVGSAFLKTAGQIMDPRKSALPYLLPYAQWAGGLGAGTGTVSGQIEGQVSGRMSPELAGGLPTQPLTGVNPSVGAPPWAPKFTSGVVESQGMAPLNSIGTIGKSPTFMPPAAGGAAGGVVSGGLPAAVGGAGAVVPPAVNNLVSTQPKVDWGTLAKTGIGLGLGEFSRRQGNKASDTALAQQQAATDAAMATNKEAFGPYMNLGGQAANTLGMLSGFAPFQGGAAGAMVPPGVVSPEQRTDDSVARRSPFSLRAGTDHSGLEDYARQANAKQQTQSGFVRMQDDDGEQMDVPANRVQEIERLGGRRI